VGVTVMVIVWGVVLCKARWGKWNANLPPVRLSEASAVDAIASRHAQ
jgi:hypothetical protein